LGSAFFFLDQGQQLCLVVLAATVVVDKDTCRITGFLFALHIEMRGWIVTHQNCRQTGLPPVLARLPLIRLPPLTVFSMLEVNPVAATG